MNKRLEDCTVKELEIMLKDAGIQRTKDGKKKVKAAMIEDLKRLERKEEQQEKAEPMNQKMKEKLEKYKEELKPGVIIAFDDNDRANSAKIMNVSFKRAELKIETAQKNIKEIPFDRILWINTRGRFPLYILRLLKNKESVKENVVGWK